MHVEDCVVNFEELSWANPAVAVRVKAVSRWGHKLRLVEFAKGFVEPDWCQKGHIGYVLEGDGELEFPSGTIKLAAGDGVFIPAGAEFKHKMHVLSPVVRVVLVEEA